MALTFDSSLIYKAGSSTGSAYYTSGSVKYYQFGLDQAGNNYTTRLKYTTTTPIKSLTVKLYCAGVDATNATYQRKITVSTSSSIPAVSSSGIGTANVRFTSTSSLLSFNIALTTPIAAGATFYIYLGPGVNDIAAKYSTCYAQQAGTNFFNVVATAPTSSEIATTTLNNQSATSAGTSKVYHVIGLNKYYSNSSCTTEITSITKPSKTGYTFGGYYTSTGGSGTQYITSAGAFTNSLYTKASQTLYAKWTANTYTLKINPNGGTYGGSSSVHTSSTKLTYGGTTHSSISPIPVRTGYTFKGYYTAASGGTQLYNSSGACIKGTSYWDSNGKYCHAGDMTLYAQWTAKSYTFTINPNGGIFGASSEPTIYTNLIYGAQNHYVIAVATRPGYKLTGYYTAATGGTKVYDAEGMRVAGTTYWNSDGFYCYDGDLTIYAQWEAAGGVVIFIDNEPKTAIPYIYKDGWKPSIPYVYKDGWKISTGV